MKKSISLFGKRTKRPYRDEFDDRDREFGGDYPGDDYDDYDDEDYPDEEFEEQYGDQLESDDYEDDFIDGKRADSGREYRPMGGFDRELDEADDFDCDYHGRAYDRNEEYPDENYPAGRYADEENPDENYPAGRYADEESPDDYSEDETYADDGEFRDKGEFYEDNNRDDRKYADDEEYSGDREYSDDAYVGNGYTEQREYAGEDNVGPSRYAGDRYSDDDYAGPARYTGDRYSDDDYADQDYADEYDREGYAEDDYDDYPEDEYYEDDYYPEDDDDYYAAAAAGAGVRGTGRRDSRGADRDRSAGRDSRRDRNADRDSHGKDRADSRRDRDSRERDSRDSRRDSRDSRKRRDHGRGDRSRRDRRERGASPLAAFGGKIVSFFRDSSVVERIAVVVALILLAGGIATGIFYSKAVDKKNDINAFAEVGTSLDGIDMIGKSGLIAVADAQRAKAMAADLIEEEEEPTEEEIIEENKSTIITMTLTSIKSDMKVKFINSETNRLVANVHFEIEVVAPDGTKVTYDDHDMDGIIYKSNITAGTYKITPKALASEYSDYTVDTTTKSLTVKDTVEMKAVDVSNEIKKESQVNAAVEDTAVQDVVESALQDTVEYVESTKTAAGEDGSSFEYEKLDKSAIQDPFSSSKAGFGTVMTVSTSRGRTEGETPDVAGETRTDDPGEGESGDNGENGEQEQPVQKEDMSVSPNSLNIKAGEQGFISGAPSGASFESSNTGVATVSSDGTVTGVSEGSATIKITASGYNDASVSVSVAKGDPVDMSVTPNSLTLKAGEKGTISGAPSGATFKSSKDSVATVSSDGTVTAVAEGSATITVSAADYNDATVSVTVTKADPLTMTLNPSSLNLKVGETSKVTASGPSSVTYKSSDEKIAKVAKDGTVTAVAEGTATITVSAKDYSDATATVTVSKADAKTFTVSPDALTLTVDDTTKLTAKGPSAVTFKSGDDKIVTVDKDGKVTAKAEGETTITVSAKDYADVIVKVTVKKKSGEAAPVKVTKVVMVQGQTFKLESKDSKVALTCKSGNDKIASVKDTTITGVAEGQTVITVSATGYSDATVNVTVVAKTAKLKDKNGNPVYVKDGDNYREATVEDYYKKDIVFYIKKAATTYKYTGWQTIDGKTYYYDKNGNYVTGEQVIMGAKYTFGGDGALLSSPGTMGIDVSKWNGNIDWNRVKNSGVNFVIIRCGYRGSSAGALIEDPKFKANIQGAQKAGLRVGVYFFTQAVNEVEAVEEASMVINQIKGYGISMPVYLDVEASNGRGDTISASQRTANIRAFCGTIQNAGYKAGVYGNKTWLSKYINTSQLTAYKIWLAQYAASPSYTATRYDMWQYTSKGSIPGISGNVDLNILYN